MERFGERYLARVFTAEERGFAATLPESERAQFLAGRFAAKEAVYKALRVPGDWPVPWTDIAIGSRPRAVVEFRGQAHAWAARIGVSSVMVSIAQAPGYAVASAIVTDAAPAPPVKTEPDSESTNTEHK